MSTSEIHGLCPAKFEPVRDAFAANFREAAELGARFTLTIEGEVVLDLWAGYADRARTKPFTEETLCPVFSSTKYIASVLIARLVDQERLDYEQTVAGVWPEFAQNGKDRITVGQAMSHQGGLAGIPDETDPQVWYDWDAACALIAAQAPLWPPGTASGYHPVTFGYIAGEIFRRIDGRTMGKALAEDLAGPFNLDLFIGLPESEDARVSEMLKPRELPRFGELTPALKAAFLSPWSAPGRRPTTEWRRVEIPSANGHATAHGLAVLASALANDGEIDGRRILSNMTRAKATRERIRGRDLVLPYEISWGAGFMRNEPNMIYGPGDQTFGHSGRGGSCVFSDPQRRVSGAYVMNHETAWLIGDPRSRRLIDAAYACL